MTLKKLKVFSLAPPFWSNASRDEERRELYPDRLCWSNDWITGKSTLEKQLDEYEETSGPGQYYKILQMIQPEIFFTTSTTPFYCKDLLPRWAQLRCIHIFSLTTLINDNTVKGLLFPQDCEFFGTDKIPDTKPWDDRSPIKDNAGKYLRGAIQLRPLLKSLLARKGNGSETLTGEDIVAFVTSNQREFDKNDAVQWTEDWSFSQIQLHEWQFNHKEIEVKETFDFIPAYKKWLKDPMLAEQVAQAFNEGIQEERTVSYPFCHSEYPGKVYLETSLCQSKEGKVWLDRPKHRGSYSNLNIEPSIGRHYSIYQDDTLQPILKKFPSYKPSV